MPWKFISFPLSLFARNRRRIRSNDDLSPEVIKTSVRKNRFLSLFLPKIVVEASTEEAQSSYEISDIGIFRNKKLDDLIKCGRRCVSE